MYELNKELKLLLLNYNESVLRLSKTKAKAERLSLLEKVISACVNQVNKEEDIDNLNKAFKLLFEDSNKLVDKYGNKVKETKAAVQAFIENKLSGLQLQQPLKKSPVEAIHVASLKSILNTLFKFENRKNKNDSNNNKDDDDDDDDDDNKDLHEWMVKVATAYLHMCPIQGQSFLIQHLVQTKNISPWAIPLIQLNYNNFTQISHSNNYIMLLSLVFAKDVVWNEDDYLAVLDQMDILTTFSEMVDSSSSSSPPNINDIVSFSKQVVDVILVPLEYRATFRNLTKRLSQTITRIAQLVYDKAGETEDVDQEELDLLMKDIIYGFSDIKKVPVGWSSLPNVPFMALSMKALWEVTCSLLYISPETSQYLPHLLENPPDIVTFQQTLNENQTQGFFMMSCLVNIATCIPPGVDDISQLDGMALACVTVISHALFTTAFVNEELRDIYYKDVRDGFGVVCSNHAFVISLLFRSTVHHISLMERMSLYLFRALPLNKWVILKDDLILLNTLFSNDTKAHKIQFAKYIVDNLNFGYRNDSRDETISKSQPWAKRKQPFLGYDIHEEVAFMLLDACHKFQPLLSEESKTGGIEMVGAVVSSAVTTYMPLAEQVLLRKTSNANTLLSKNPTFVRDFINWSWKIMLRIKLYDCPVSSRAADIEKSISLSFLRLILNNNSNHSEESTLHASLLVYVSFMLTTTSRHFLRFESGNGWMKLLTILRRGNPEAVIHALCEMIPSFVYMHGDDFFNDESLSDLLIHMTQLKSDPGLVKTASEMNKTKGTPYYGTCGVSLVIGSTIWQAKFIDSVSQLMDESGAGFSYLDLVLHSWLKTLLRKPDWMWDTYCVAMVDCVCKIAFTLGNRVAYKIFSEERKRLEAAKNQNDANSQRITRFLNSTIAGDAFPSLLVGEWSMLNFKANTFYKTPGIEKHQFWFAFEVLLIETKEEQQQREELATAIAMQLEKLPATIPHSHLDISAIHKSIHTPHRKPFEFFSIFRWVDHILTLPLNHPLLLLYLQVFFSLYYESTYILVGEDKTELVYGYMFFNRKPDMITKLHDTIANIQTFYGQKMANLGHDSEAQDNAYSLQQIYYSMWLWLGQGDILKPNFDPKSLPQHYSVSRFEKCYKLSREKQPWNDFALFWMDLIDMGYLEHSFLQFPWESAEKFQRDATTPDDVSSNVDTISLFRTQRYIPQQSTVVNLPSLDTALSTTKRN